jgi:peroxiredoxin
MRPDIRPGASFPDYELPDHTDTARKLSLLQGSDPMIVVIVRGYFCPKDKQQLQELVPFSAHCVVGYARLVTISTDTLLQVNELRQGLGADWPFLHDEKRIVQRDLQIQEYTDPDHDPMIPHTFVLEPGLRIHKTYSGYYFWGRPTPHELHLDLRAISMRIRPDWRIDTPEMRARWERGEKDPFFPYGRSFKEVIARSANAFDQIH